MQHHITAIAVASFAVAVTTGASAAAGPWDPEDGRHVDQQQIEPWPDEGSGYPGYADPAPQPVESVGPTTTLDSTSVALGAMGGIALGGAALAVTLVVHRRRDHLESRTLLD
jgi:hypothetical protein